MSDSDEFSHSDRVMTIGVLATLSACFLADESAEAGAVVDRYRRDLSAVLGHRASDRECFESLESQLIRLRHSIGERW